MKSSNIAYPNVSLQHAYVPPFFIIGGNRICKCTFDNKSPRFGTSHVTFLPNPTLSLKPNLTVSVAKLT